MFQTYTSCQSQTSQSPTKFKFKSKVSFFNDGLPQQQQTKVNQQYREQLRYQIDQQTTQFVLLPEFATLKLQQIGISVQYAFNPRYNSTGLDETKESFQDLLDEIKQTINRKYPFVRLFLRSQIPDSDDHYLQIQLYSSEDQVVLYSKQCSKSLPTAKYVADAAWLFLKKFNLTVNVDCANKNVHAVCEESVNNVLEGLKVVIRQRENTLQSVQTPTKQMVIRTSFCQPSSGQKSASKVDIFKSSDNIKDMEKSVRVYFSPSKTSTWMTQTSSIELSGQKRAVPEKKFTVKLFSQTQMTTCFEEAKFTDLIQQVNSYEIEISGESIQTTRTIINVDEILTNSEQLFISTRVQRTDILKCIVKAPQDSIITVIKAGVSEQLTDFEFWARVQQEYVIEVTKKDCFPQKKTIFIQGNSDCIIEFDLVSCVETTLQFKAYNILSGKEIEQVKLELFQSDQIDQEPLVGITENNGVFVCSGLMFKQVRVHAKRKGFLQVSYDFDVRANSTGQVLQIPMIPDFYSLINQYHILIYVPNKKNFQLDYSMTCSDNYKLDQKQKIHPVMKAKLEVNRIGTSSVLWNFQVHVQSLDPFLRDNCFTFFVNNQKPKKVLMCQEPLSPQFKENQGFTLKSRKTINEMFLKTRVMQTEVKTMVKQESDVIAQKIHQFCAEESVRVFITFGHKVIDTFMIQTNLILQNEKCFGVIDLDKRAFIKDSDIQQVSIQRNLNKMPTFKSQPQEFDDRKLSTILSHITNQKFTD